MFYTDYDNASLHMLFYKFNLCNYAAVECNFAHHIKCVHVYILFSFLLGVGTWSMGYHDSIKFSASACPGHTMSLSYVDAS